MKVYVPTSFKGVAVHPDGRAVVMELETKEGEVGFLVPTKSIAGVVSILLRAEGRAHEKAGLGQGTTTFRVKEVALRLPVDKDGLVVTLTLPDDLQLGFRVDTESARRLSLTLAQLVAQSGESPRTIQ
jgi:hypothetical protein